MTPQIDINRLAIQNLPPNKRKPVWIMFIQAMVYVLDWWMGIFRQYQSGGVTGFYNSGVTYNSGERIVYNYRSYESLANGNIGNTPDTSPNSWLEVNGHFIGMSERSLYQAKKLTLEYALNHYFTEELQAHGYIGFRQPDSAFTPTSSDIYIETVTPAYVSITGFSDLHPENTITFNPSGYYAFSTLITGTSSTYMFTVNIPILVYISINPDATIAEGIVRAFVDKYRLVGTNYSIVIY